MAAIDFEWGPVGAGALASEVEVIVVVDVLSFTTCVSIACSRGMTVVPCPDDATGRHLSASLGAALAVSRRRHDADHPYTLSPAHIATAPLAECLVLPSPNGSAISSLAAPAGVTVVAACLRNAPAVARWLVAAGYGTARRRVAVIASGERWPDGSLRPAIEDLLGAGMVLDVLARSGRTLSGEGSAAARAVIGLDNAAIAKLVRTSRSGRELISIGYGDDVEMAVAVGADASAVPVIPAGAVPRAYSSQGVN